ncbi:hypothetical protein ACFXJ5_37945 [Streptomyces sp. NPDC059373]
MNTEDESVADRHADFLALSRLISALPAVNKQQPAAERCDLLPCRETSP